MSTKRLRGWSLQKELAVAHPCERDTPSSSSKSPSQLATKLLSLWAHGTLSAVMVQQIAHLALLDGASHSDLYTISKTGNFGQFTGNAHRDLTHEFAANICVDIHPVVTAPLKKGQQPRCYLMCFSQTSKKVTHPDLMSCFVGRI